MLGLPQHSKGERRGVRTDTRHGPGCDRG
nr:hypothetical protein 1.17 [Burkholderia phage Bups phi1]